MGTHIDETEGLDDKISPVPENVLLRQRPSMNIRTKVAVSFILFFILSLTITGWSYWILTKLEHKIEILEIADGYMVEIQQARRFEKNYLLYRTDLDDALEHLKKANQILTENSQTIEKVFGSKYFKTMVSFMTNYHDLLVQLGNAQSDEERKSIVPQLREFGSEMVSFGGEFVRKEQNSSTQMFSLAKRIPFFFIFLLLLLMVFVLMFLTRQLLSSLNRFMEYTRRIGEGDFSPIMPARKYKDEFTKLAEAFNHMISELDHKHNVLLESHKLRAIGTLVAGVAHELNNPLNNTLLTASMLIEDFDILSKEEKVDMVQDVINETERSQKVVRNLLDFARESETDIVPLDIKKLVEDSIALVSNQVRMAKIKMSITCEDNLPRIHGDEQKLKQVFVNLVLNAVDVLPSNGKITVSVKKDNIPGYVLVSVEDNGPGIPEQIQSRIFEPFFTTKGQSKGTGLGLSVSRGIVRKLGGSLRFSSEPDNGTTFTVSLPTTDSPSEIMSKKV